MFSILNQLETYRAPDGSFTFKLYWPEPWNQWQQTSNPVTTPGTGSVTGYSPVSIAHTDNNWGGLQYDDGPDSLLDGSVGTTLWYYAIGSTTPWNGGIPSWDPPVNVVELYIRSDNGTSVTNINFDPYAYP